MGKILTVTHRNGSTFNLQCKGNEVWGITSATQSIELNGNDTATVAVLSTTPLPFALGDTIAIYGKVYTLNEPPKETKTGERRYQYTCTFEGEQYKLLNPLWQMPFSAINDTYTGTLADFAALLVSNIVRIYGSGSWVVGNVPENTATKTLCYADTNCLDVLQQICSEWEVEFTIGTNGNTHVLEFYPTIGGSIDHEFTYGLIGGGYELQRNGTSDPDFGTRIYFYGGSNNIPNSYFNSRQSPRLCLARKVVGTTQTSNPNKANSYIQQPNAVNLYGLIERVKVFEEIYPNRIGKVTAIDNDNERVFFDDTMFELDKKTGGNTDYLIAGTTAKVHFNTGLCAGYDFDIAAFTWKDDDGNIIGKFTINAITDENNYVFPSHDNNAFRIATGDEYIITDIVMPTAYVTAAQNELQTAAQGWYEKHCAPAIEYTMNLDQQFVKRLAADLGITDGVVFHIGDKIKITDAEMGFVQKEFRITQFTRDLTRAYAYTLKIAETDTHRAKYNWRRRTRVIPGLFERLGLTDVSRLAADANQAAISRQAYGIGNDNTVRIGMIIDDDNKLRPVIIPDNAIATRMLNGNAVTSAKIANNAIIASKIAADAVTAEKLAGGIPRNKLNLDALVNFERFTPVIATREDGTKITVSNGIYINSFLGNDAFQIEATEISKDYKEAGIDPQKSYYLYFDSDERKVICHDEQIIDKENVVYLGMASAVDTNKERTFTMATQATEQPISGGRMVSRNGNSNFTLAEEIESARAIRNFITGSDTGTLSIKDDTGVKSTLLAIIGAQLGYGLRYKVGDLIDKVGEDAQDTGGLLYRAAQLENGRSTHMGKINELIDSIYSANEILLSIQNNFNTMRKQLLQRNLINQSSDTGTVNELGIGRCTWNPLQQVEQCAVDPQGIGIPSRLT